MRQLGARGQELGTRKYFTLLACLKVLLLSFFVQPYTIHVVTVMIQSLMCLLYNYLGAGALPGDRQ